MVPRSTQTRRLSDNMRGIWIRRKASRGLFVLSTMLLGSASAAPITYLSATRSVAISGSMVGTNYGDSVSSAGFGAFDEAFAFTHPASSTMGGQASNLMPDGIQSQTLTSAFANGNAGEATASAETVLAVTFRITETTPFSLLAARVSSGLGVPYPTFRLTDAGGSTVFEWRHRFSGSNWTFNEDPYGFNVSASGLLLPSDYTLLISQSLFFVRPGGFGYDGGSQRLAVDLGVADVPEAGTTVVFFGATLMGLIGIERGRRRRRAVRKASPSRPSEPSCRGLDCRNKRTTG
jgi:hypothetical protein